MQHVKVNEFGQLSVISCMRSAFCLPNVIGLITAKNKGTDPSIMGVYSVSITRELVSLSFGSSFLLFGFPAINDKYSYLAFF